MNNRSDTVRLAATATAPAGTGGIDLSRYPGLTHAPHQWGAGVRLARNGVPVVRLLVEDDIDCARRALEGAAESTGCTLDELCDVMRYARDKGIA